MNSPREALVNIHGIAAGGAGVGRLPDGRAVFVHRTAPGDEARIRVVQEKRRWARGTLVSVERPGPDRRPPPCPHYGRCGGCTLEHMTYAAQLRAKREVVAAALRRIGGVEAYVPEVVASPAEVRYRNRVSFSLLRSAGRVQAGFHALEQPGTVVDVDGGCLLPEEAVARTWDALRHEWGPGARLLPPGKRLRLTLRATVDGVCTLLVEGGEAAVVEAEGEAAGPRAEQLVAAVPALAAVWWRSTAGEPPVLLAGAELVMDRWRDQPVRLQGALFLQVNRGAAALLEDHVLVLARDAGPETAVDAYCGVGRYARALAAMGVPTVGIEADPHAVTEARRGAPAGTRFVAGRVEDALPELLPSALLVTNPPRAGMAADVVAALLAAPTRRVIYVSCDPATLARDLGRLEAVYRLRGVRAFDLFPQTAHVETVVELEQR
ncbi:MAG: 23S rRNA (uracil(1939)-C(5))-methyltransferase RlmD [Gemmatimonadota bacterium]